MQPTDHRMEPATGSWSYPDFQQALIGAATQLSALAELAEALELTALHAAIDRTLARLHAGAFSVAVVGEFKRGKTTFINALLGRAVLPADVVPCSATISRLVYGRTPRAEIHFRGGEVRVVELAELDRYITHVTEEAARIAATVRQAVVAYPTLFCQNNVTIVDTPGLSDTEAFTRLTLDVVPHSDAAVFVVSALAPFSETEGEILLRLLKTFDLDRLLFVVNQIDQIGDADAADRVVARVRNRIAERIVRAGLAGEESADILAVAGRLRVFGLSAHLALQAKLARDAELLATSRLPDFEQVLEQFLVRDRGVVALRPALRVLTEGGQAVLAALAPPGDDGQAPTAPLDPWLRRELDAIVTEASAREHHLPERLATMRLRLANLAATLEQGLIDAAHDAINTAQALQNPSLKPTELELWLSAIVEHKIQHVNYKRQAAAQAVLDDWIAEELAVLDALSQRLDTVAVRLPPVDERAQGVCIGRDHDWIQAMRRQVSGVWPDFLLDGPTPKQAGDLLATVARPTLGLLGTLVGSETVARGVSSVFRRFGTGAGDTVAKGVRSLQSALGDGMKMTVRAHAERTIHRLLTQTSLPVQLDRIVTEVGDTLRALLHREVESLVRRAYTTQADLAALEERQRAEAAQRQADITRLRDRAETILAAGARLAVCLSR